jgi:flagellar motor component MotA
MNILQLLSLALAATVFFVSVVTSTDNPKAMVDFHGMLIVIGGTVSASAISFELKLIVVEEMQSQYPIRVKTRS